MVVMAIMGIMSITIKNGMIAMIVMKIVMIATKRIMVVLYLILNWYRWVREIYTQVYS